MLVKDEFLKVVCKYEPITEKQLRLWSEIEKHYSSSKRHYHNLTHLESLTQQLIALQSNFENWDVIVSSIVYHDVVYNVRKNDNEEKSAEYATKKLKEFSFPDSLTQRCASLILSTKKHEDADRETNLFTDADLSILGSSSSDYKNYALQIRKEYRVYPDFLYNSGRKKVLNHFLNMKMIFKSNEFGERYEKRARLNLLEELKTLG